MTVAIAILNWNGKNWLKKFLPSVIKYSQDTAIYVIDNASTDDSIKFLKTNFPSVKIVQNISNSGFAAGYNEGLKSINSEIYCLLNSDVEVTDNWLSPIIDLFSQDKNIAAVQPKILDYNQKNKFEFAGAGGGLIDNLGYPYCRGRIFDDVETDSGQYDDETEIFWASGCSLFIRSEDFWNMNGFDERFFAHQEEIDLCWRLKNAGKKIYYTGKSTVYHVGGGTLNKQNPRKTFLNFRNNLTMLVKNLPFYQVVPVIFARLVLDGFAGLYFGYKNGWSHLWAVLKAHFAFYAEIPHSLKLRQKHQIKIYYQSKWLIFKHFLGSKNQ
ncbi:glycosyltransferase family 2 protein [Epilithonimonas arachidiradicis]|uniref:GT2 family glycosyltransferase n=1 Tax=Epilithonimonas arachidiradicis TaxID=1617282 RepID=A0A420CXP2_9FLAO|nr:glycosyltransferase [Epilithonimonas arachidiradicis]RKE83072.1 GT2 family glycosyltransferase [Epilithonimonas arachidiradicis]GGG64777.1 glycosyl transferase family 2 [Epilithonimonas arachidiradicis]